MLILGVPHAKNAGSQRLSIYIFSFLMIIVFSMLVSLFRIKNPSKSTFFLIELVDSSRHFCRLPIPNVVLIAQLKMGKGGSDTREVDKT